MEEAFPQPLYEIKEVAAEYVEQRKEDGTSTITRSLLDKGATNTCDNDEPGNLSPTACFLHLSPELRAMIYAHLFANVSVKLHRRIWEGWEETRGLLDFAWPHASFEDTDYTIDEILEEDDDFFYEDVLLDDHDDFITNPMNDSQLYTYARRCRKDSWRDPSSPGLASIECRDLEMASSILIICRTVYAEAWPVLASRIDIIIQSSRTSADELCSAPVHRYFDSIQRLTFSPCAGNFMYRFNFLPWNMSSLKVLHVLESGYNYRHLSYIDPSVDMLASCAFGAKDDSFIRSWYEFAHMLRRKEDGFVSSYLNPTVRRLLREKNRSLYWLRELLLDSSLISRPRSLAASRAKSEDDSANSTENDIGEDSDDDSGTLPSSCQIIKRWHIVLNLRHVKRPRSSTLQGHHQYKSSKDKVLQRCDVYVTIDFDVDTQQVVDRRVKDRWGHDVKDETELGEWLMGRRVRCSDGDLVCAPMEDNQSEELYDGDVDDENDQDA